MPTMPKSVKVTVTGESGRAKADGLVTVKVARPAGAVAMTEFAGVTGLAQPLNNTPAQTPPINNASGWRTK
jgi:hypothetical protein